MLLVVADQYYSVLYVVHVCVYMVVLTEQTAGKINNPIMINQRQTHKPHSSAAP